MVTIEHKNYETFWLIEHHLFILQKKPFDKLLV